MGPPPSYSRPSGRDPLGGQGVAELPGKSENWLIASSRAGRPGEHRADVGDGVQQRDARADLQVGGVRGGARTQLPSDPGVDPVEVARQLSQVSLDRLVADVVDAPLDPRDQRRAATRGEIGHGQLRVLAVAGDRRGAAGAASTRSCDGRAPAGPLRPSARPPRPPARSPARPGRAGARGAARRAGA